MGSEDYLGTKEDGVGRTLVDRRKHEGGPKERLHRTIKKTKVNTCKRRKDVLEWTDHDMLVGLPNDGLLLLFGLRSKELLGVFLERDLGEEAAGNVEVAVVGRLRSGGLELIDNLDVDRGLFELLLEGRRLAHGGLKAEEAGQLGERVERCSWCEARPGCVWKECDHLSDQSGSYELIVSSWHLAICFAVCSTASGFVRTRTTGRQSILFSRCLFFKLAYSNSARA